jgi:hypothetical protein
VRRRCCFASGGLAVSPSWRFGLGVALQGGQLDPGHLAPALVSVLARLRPGVLVLAQVSCCLDPVPGPFLARSWPVPGPFLARSWPVPGPSLAQPWPSLARPRPGVGPGSVPGQLLGRSPATRAPDWI